MRKLVAVHVMLTPGGMIGPGQKVPAEVIDIACVTGDGVSVQCFRSVVRPADQRMIAKLTAVMDMDELRPGTLWGDLMMGLGCQLPDAVEQLEGWWASHVGVDRFAGSARPVLVAHDAFTVRSRLREHMPLVEELFSDTIDVTSLRAVTDLADEDSWGGYRWADAKQAATDAWGTYWAIWRRVNEPASAVADGA